MTYLNSKPKTMNNFSSKLLLTIVITFSLTACGNVSNDVENKLNTLKNKTKSLDSIINKEVGKVSTLDSLINKESEKVKKLDTLINKTSHQLDSISKKGSKLLEKFIN
jgi:peptidoglycan hydrolase CwlO-like protein